jgi:Glycosyl transferase family 90
MKVLKGLESALLETGDDPVCFRTLDYIFTYLHHNCYLLKVVGGQNELIKLQSSMSPPSARKTLRKKVKKDKTIRVLGCIVKPFKASTSAEWEKFVGQVSGLNDGLYILNLTDALMLRKDRTVPWPILGSGKLDAKYHGEMLPIFGGSTAEGYEDIAIPTYDDVRIVLGYDKVPEAEHSWDQKDAKVVFRGSSTGCGRKADTNMRLKVASLEYPWLDAGITKLTKNLKFDPKHGLGKVDSISLVPKMSFAEQSKHKYILNIDGNVAAYRLLTWMQTGSVILKVKGPFRVWYEDKLVHRKTVVEVKEDLSDLEEQYNWCIENDAECHKIAERALKVSKKLLTLDAVTKDFKNKLSKY